ncbi:MAG: hypothetical protein GY873_13625 [Bosea sp.]|nr:hypothetical protein [Bosea sp. (in: a-proteobacteria)]MCP4735220.1 hypothetical protein [Bosea sp. (in: a-proteobacteria)]
MDLAIGSGHQLSPFFLEWQERTGGNVALAGFVQLAKDPNPGDRAAAAAPGLELERLDECWSELPERRVTVHRPDQRILVSRFGYGCDLGSD